MICISFDQVILYLITKVLKEKPIFYYFAFFSIRKVASHKNFPFLELLKYCLQLFKKGHMTRSHDYENLHLAKPILLVIYMRKWHVSIFRYFSRSHAPTGPTSSFATKSRVAKVDVGLSIK